MSWGQRVNGNGDEERGIAATLVRFYTAWPNLHSTVKISRDPRVVDTC